MTRHWCVTTKIPRENDSTQIVNPLRIIKQAEEGTLARTFHVSISRNLSRSSRVHTQANLRDWPTCLCTQQAALHHQPDDVPASTRLLGDPQRPMQMHHGRYRTFKTTSHLKYKHAVASREFESSNRRCLAHRRNTYTLPPVKRIDHLQYPCRE